MSNLLLAADKIYFQPPNNQYPDPAAYKSTSCEGFLSQLMTSRGLPALNASNADYKAKNLTFDLSKAKQSPPIIEVNTADKKLQLKTSTYSSPKSANLHESANTIKIFEDLPYIDRNKAEFFKVTIYENELPFDFQDSPSYFAKDRPKEFAQQINHYNFWIVTNSQGQKECRLLFIESEHRSGESQNNPKFPYNQITSNYKFNQQECLEVLLTLHELNMEGVRGKLSRSGGKLGNMFMPSEDKIDAKNLKFLATKFERDTTGAERVGRACFEAYPNFQNLHPEHLKLLKQCEEFEFKQCPDKLLSDSKLEREKNPYNKPTQKAR